MNYEHSFISHIASELQPEERKGSLVCPFCDGGKTRERSFGVGKRKDGTIYYKCFRVHCGKSGVAGQSRSNSSFSPSNRRTVERPVLPPLQDVEGPWKTRLTEHGIGTGPTDTSTKLGWQTSDNGTCLWIPLRTCDGVHIGYEARRISGDPKSRIFRFNKDSFVRNFCERSPRSSEDVLREDVLDRNLPTLVVEDSISALKASQITDTYSLQGTNFTTDHLFELVSYMDERIVLLALDKDATQKAAGLVRRYRFYSQFIRICPLQVDVKHLNLEEIKELVDRHVESSPE